MHYEINENNEVTIGKKKLVCPICSGKQFEAKFFLLNKTGSAFWNVDWLDDNATNFICEQCGYIFWFSPTLKNKFAVNKEDGSVNGKPFLGSEIDKII